jgi:hypothetical protein
MSASVAQLTHFGFGTHASPSSNTDRSTYFHDLKFPRQAAEVDVTTFGNNGNKSFLPGLKEATFPASGNYDSTIGAHLDAIFDGQDTVTFEYGPISTATGMPKYTGSMICTKFEIGAAVGEKIPFTCEFRITGAVTLAAY